MGVGIMKRILILLIAIVFLVACGEVKVHDNVDAQVAKDSIQVMDRIMYNVDKEIPIEEVDEKDDRIFERYYERYIGEEDTIPLNLEVVDESIVVMGSASLVRYAKGASLESDKEYILENHESMLEYLETGESARSRMKEGD